MSENTKIEWCTHSWSPWRGCTKVSPGCANCYAETLSKRNPGVLGQWGKGKPRVLAKNWRDPVRWNRKRDHSLTLADPMGMKLAPVTVFPSLCDWLDEEVPIEWLVRFLTLIHNTPDLTWLLLTKRPENWRDRLIAARVCIAQMAPKADLACQLLDWARWSMWIERWVHGAESPTNVWVGTSVEDQTRADERIPALLDIPAAGRFLSVEPLLGEVDLPYSTFNGSDAVSSMEGINWVIVGGESGPGSRPCNVEWVRSVVRDCQGASVPVFVKQLGKEAVRNLNPGEYHPERPEGKVWPFFLNHPKGGDPAEWPEDLRVREFPKALGGAR